MGIIKSDSFVEWREVVEDSVNSGFIKFHSKIGFLLNIIIPVFLLFFLKVSIPTYFLLFIAFDFVQVILDLIILYFHKSIFKFNWLIQKGSYKNKLNDMSLSEIEALKKDLDSSNSFYCEKLNIINKKLEEFKNFEQLGTNISRKNEIDFVNEMILKFKEYNKTPWIKDYMDAIVEVSEKIINLVKEDEEAVSVIVNTYNVYAEELINIIIRYDEMEEEQKEKYENKLIKLMDVFCKHLEEQEDKIIKFREHSVDFDIDFLTKKILTDGKENED